MMEKIIQMTQYEYDRMADLAKINEDEINIKAAMHGKKY